MKFCANVALGLGHTSKYDIECWTEINYFICCDQRVCSCTVGEVHFCGAFATSLNLANFSSEWKAAEREEEPSSLCLHILLQTKPGATMVTITCNRLYISKLPAPLILGGHLNKTVK